MKKSGDFGALIHAYDAARSGYEQEVLNIFFVRIQKLNPRILDLGCGTGISTRLLTGVGSRIAGCDIDLTMLRAAKTHGMHKLAYSAGDAEMLPFKDGIFHAVTAFGALHWFSNDAALSEIKRVLEPGGLFFAVNKNDRGNFKRDFKKIVEEATGEAIVSVKQDYDAAQLMRQTGFKHLRDASILSKELFSLERALRYIQSISYWNLVPHDKRENVLAAAKICFEGKLKNNLITRYIENRAVLGFKA